MKIVNNIFKRKKPENVLEEVTLGSFPDFTKKEIFTQGELIDKLLNRYIKADKINFDSLKIKLNKIKRIYVTGSGIDYSCAVFGAYNLEVLADVISVPISNGEFIYSNPILDKNTLVISLSDDSTVEKRALATGARLIKIVDFCDNKSHISLDWKALGEFETATYTLKLTAIAMLCLYFGEKNQIITALYSKIAMQMLRELSKSIKRILSQEFIIKETAVTLDYDDMVITGTNVDYAIAIYASRIFSKFSEKPIPAIPLSELYTVENKYTPLAFASNTDFYSLLNTESDYQLIITPSNIGNNMNALVYEEVLPLLNPILSGVAAQLLAYCKGKDMPQTDTDSSDSLENL